MTLEAFRRICGVKHFKSVVIAPEYWSGSGSGTTITNELELQERKMAEFSEKDDLWGSLIRGGSKVVPYYGTASSAHAILDAVLSLPGRDIELAFTEQLVSRLSTEKAWSETYAGEILFRQLKERERALHNQKEEARRRYREALDARNSQG